MVMGTITLNRAETLHSNHLHLPSVSSEYQKLQRVWILLSIALYQQNLPAKTHWTFQCGTHCVHISLKDKSCLSCNRILPKPLVPPSRDYLWSPSLRQHTSVFHNAQSLGRDTLWVQLAFRKARKRLYRSKTERNSTCGEVSKMVSSS